MSGLNTVRFRLTMDFAFTADSSEMTHAQMDAAARQFITEIGEHGVRTFDGDLKGLTCRNVERAIEVVG